MWFSRGFAELILRRIDDLERRVKRLEQLEYETSKKKIASLQDKEAGKENMLAIEEIINKNRYSISPRSSQYEELQKEGKSK